MKFGYSTNAFVKFPLAAALEKIANLGFKAVEIMCDRPHLYPPDFDRQALSNIRDILQKHRLGVTNLNSFSFPYPPATLIPAIYNTHGALPEWGPTGMPNKSCVSVLSTV